MITTGFPTLDSPRTSFSSSATLKPETNPSAVVALKHSSKTLVVKFGGSSLRDKDRVSKAAGLIAKESAKGTAASRGCIRHGKDD